MQNKNKKAWIILGVFLTLVIIVVLWFYFTNFFPYMDSEQKLRSESSLIVIPSATLVSQIYSGGYCFDNCPQLSETFRIKPSTVQDASNTVATALSEAHYKIYTNYQGVTASDSKFEVDAMFPIGSIQSQADNSKIINSFTINIDYNPSLN